MLEDVPDLILLGAETSEMGSGFDFGHMTVIHHILVSLGTIKVSANASVVIAKISVQKGSNYIHRTSMIHLARMLTLDLECSILAGY